MLFNKGDKIGPYTVVFPHRKTATGETYRVKDVGGKLCMLKLLNGGKESDGELQLLANLSHPNLVKIYSTGAITRPEKMSYIVGEFLHTERLEAYQTRQGVIKGDDALRIVTGVLNALIYLHEQERPIVHGGITLCSVLLCPPGEGERVRLGDFSHAHYADEKTGAPEFSDNIALLFTAGEELQGEGQPSSDVFSVGALLFKLLFGVAPWQNRVNIDTITAEDVIKARQSPLALPSVIMQNVEENLLNCILKALSPQPEKRFTSAREMLSCLQGHTKVDNVEISTVNVSADNSPKKGEKPKPRRGNGFADVAGMEEVKALLRDKIIKVLCNPAEAERLRLQIPNGMLLYGPPGCGKSFLAEKFAEEAGYNYRQIKSSDLASVYVHGSQEKIGALFDEARQNAPIILNFEEFEALVPRRGAMGTEHQAGEVNEFLAQMNNCGKDHIFIIASTNRPDLIDPAVKRRGRIDYEICVPLPDAPARAGIFAVHLKGRPQAENIDTVALAALTDGFTASDIAYMVNEAAMRIFGTDSVITQDLLQTVISETTPSVTENKRPSVGFKIN